MATVTESGWPYVQRGREQEFCQRLCRVFTSRDQAAAWLAEFFRRYVENVRSRIVKSGFDSVGFDVWHRGMKFIGRRQELKLMEQHYATGHSVLLPIYGRRRVGKSRMIEKFIAGKPNINFLGKRTTAEMQLKDFREAACTA